MVEPGALRGGRSSASSAGQKPGASTSRPPPRRAPRSGRGSRRDRRRPASAGGRGRSATPAALAHQEPQHLLAAACASPAGSRAARPPRRRCAASQARTRSGCMNGVACTSSPRAIVARQSSRFAGSQIASHERSQSKRQPRCRAIARGTSHGQRAPVLGPPPPSNIPCPSTRLLRRGCPQTDAIARADAREKRIGARSVNRVAKWRSGDVTGRPRAPRFAWAAYGAIAGRSGTADVPSPVDPDRWRRRRPECPTARPPRSRRRRASAS